MLRPFESPLHQRADHCNRDEADDECERQQDHSVVYNIFCKKKESHDISINNFLKKEKHHGHT